MWINCLWKYAYPKGMSPVIHISKILLALHYFNNNTNNATNNNSHNNNNVLKPLHTECFLHKLSRTSIYFFELLFFSWVLSQNASITQQKVACFWTFTAWIKASTNKVVRNGFSYAFIYGYAITGYRIQRKKSFVNLPIHGPRQQAN